MKTPSQNKRPVLFLFLLLFVIVLGFPTSARALGGDTGAVDGRLRNFVARLNPEPVPTPSPAPPLPYTNGKIAFTTYGFPQTQICVVDPDGSHLTQLTHTTIGWGSDSPSWSPDGTKIAFSGWGLTPAARRDIYVMNSDGSNPTRLTQSTDTFNNYLSPAWSPDGRRIAFAKVPNDAGTGNDRVFQIYVMNADGSDQVRLTNTSMSSYTPAWSPDGTRIAFVGGSGNSYQIYTMELSSDSRGRNQLQLTSAPGFNQSPAWSPDGSKIAFASNRSNSWQIYLMDADGQGQTNLTTLGAASYNAPVWSPDGSKIAFNFGNLYFVNVHGVQVGSVNVPGLGLIGSWQRGPADH